MKLVLITTKIGSMIPAHGKVFQYNYYVIKFFIDLLHMFPTDMQGKIAHLKVITGFPIRYHPQTKNASKFHHKFKKNLNSHKIHLHAKSSDHDVS
jgi:hypothetical protein